VASVVSGQTRRCGRVGGLSHQTRCTTPAMFPKNDAGMLGPSAVREQTATHLPSFRLILAVDIGLQGSDCSRGLSDTTGHVRKMLAKSSFHHQAALESDYIHLHSCLPAAPNRLNRQQTTPSRSAR
jgi:hypothetical protein